MSLKVAKSILCTFSATAIYTTWYLFMNNGSSDLMIHVRDVGPRILPGTNEPLKTSYTGIQRIDYELTVLTLCFWEMVDGSLPNASLLCFHFVGQIAAGWGLFMLEALRSGNRGRWISFLTIWGLLMQRFSFAVIMPLYLVLHLSTSPTAWSRKPSDFYVDSAEHATILASITVGFLVPTILMVLPAPSVISFDKKQTYLAFWQVFPIWVQLFQKARYFLPKILTSDHKKISAKSIKLDSEYLFSLRLIYAILLAFAGCTHIATMTLIITSKFFPGLFAEEFVGVFNPSKVFWPLSISVSTEMRSIGSGVFQFLQYDEFVGSIAVCFWASFLAAKVLNKENIRNPGKARSVLKSWLPVQSLLSVSLFGPLGYAVICIWARDEAIMNEAKTNTAAGGEEKEKR